MAAVALPALAVAVLATPRPAPATEQFEDVPVIVATVNAVLESARTGSVNPWENPATGTHGSITIEKTYFRAGEIPCRDYTRRTEGTPPTITRGTGCRDNVGLWRLTETATTVEPAVKPPVEPRATIAAAAKAPAPPDTVEPAAAEARDLPKPRTKPPVLSGSMPSRSN